MLGLSKFSLVPWETDLAFYGKNAKNINIMILRVVLTLSLKEGSLLYHICMKLADAIIIRPSPVGSKFREFLAFFKIAFLVFHRIFHHFLIISCAFNHISSYVYIETAHNSLNTSGNMYIELVLVKNSRFPIIFKNLKRSCVRYLLSEFRPF